MVEADSYNKQTVFSSAPTPGQWQKRVDDLQNQLNDKQQALEKALEEARRAKKALYEEAERAEGLQKQ